ncbi:MAG TPA: MFS transporter [Burkholderiaceae bacterium]|nr:MFS transporter [Burkholderiaceae bacterium]
MTLKTLSPKRELWLLLTLAGIQLSHILDFMIMMPLGPQFTRIFAITDAQFGMLVSAYTLAAGASGLLAATYLDKVDRKKLLLTLYVLFGLATLACGLAPTYSSLMLARVMAGMFGGVLSALSQTIIGDVIPFERRGRAMGIVMTSFSVATVAGVPLGLFLAAHFSWHAPFFGIAALVGVLAIGASITLPSLTAHLNASNKPSAWGGIQQVLSDPNHWKAFAFSALLMFAGFTVIPFLTIYLQSNVGWKADQVPYVYLCGGLATFFTSRWVGIMADRKGKVFMFKIMAVLLTLPMVMSTLTAGLPVWAVLMVSTTFFVFMNGRMVPGMAIITSAANPALRGTFMALNSSVQSASMGIAAFIGGMIISRDAQNMVQHYWINAAVGTAASLAAFILVKHLKLYQTNTLTAQSTETTQQSPITKQ